VTQPGSIRARGDGYLVDVDVDVASHPSLYRYASLLGAGAPACCPAAPCRELQRFNREAAARGEDAAALQRGHRDRSRVARQRGGAALQRGAGTQSDEHVSRRMSWVSPRLPG
jgi:hypothetical protein